MMGKMEYLTDTELEKLICELEQNDMVQAPPDMKLEILQVLEYEISKKKISNISEKELLKPQTSEISEQETRKPQMQQMPEQELFQQEERKKQDNIIAYKRYRFRVLTTVVASVVLVFLLPRLEGLQQTESDLFKPIQWQEEVMQREFATREEALNDKGMLETWLGGVNIFADNSKWNLFKENNTVLK